VKNEGFFFSAKTGAESREQSFGVIAGERGLDESGFSCGVKGGEENARFHLGTGDLAGEVDRLEWCAANGERRTIFRAFTDEVGTKFSKWVSDSSHGTTGEGGVTKQACGEGVTCDHAGEKSHGGAAIAAIDRFCGSEEFCAAAFNQNLIRGDTIDSAAEGLESVKSGEAIFAWKKTAQAGASCGNAPEHDAAVGDAFISGYGELCIELSDGADFEMVHAWGRVRRIWAASAKIFVREATSFFSMALERWVSEE
jgi:hypothetical protein